MERSHMKIGKSLDADKLLEMYYLDMRSALLETAAGMDRIARAPGFDEGNIDPRLLRLRKAAELLTQPGDDRVVKFHLFFSEEDL